MQAIAFPEAVSTEIVRRTLLEVAWHLHSSHELTNESFVEMLSLNAADNGGAALFIEAIHMAIKEDNLSLARQLTDRGLQHFCNNHALLDYREVLAPPKIIGTSPAVHNFSKTMHWLATHSHEYGGQWLALQDGELLGASSSRKTLIEKLGGHAEAEDVMITRVPST